MKLWCDSSEVSGKLMEKMHEKGYSFVRIHSADKKPTLQDDNNSFYWGFESICKRLEIDLK